MNDDQKKELGFGLKFGLLPLIVCWFGSIYVNNRWPEEDFLFFVVAIPIVPACWLVFFGLVPLLYEVYKGRKSS